MSHFISREMEFEDDFCDLLHSFLIELKLFCDFFKVKMRHFSKSGF